MTEKAGKTNADDRGSEGSKLRLTYSKTGLIRFISHRDLMRVLFRAFSRAGLPVAYSRGFSPHPVVSFCPPLKVGMEGLNELLDLSLARPLGETSPERLLNPHLPEGIEIRDSHLLLDGAPSLHARLKAVEYRVELEEPVVVSQEAVDKFLSAAEVISTRLRKGQEEKIDARMGVVELLREGDKGLKMVLSLKDIGRPYPVLTALSGADPGLLPGLLWQRLRFLP